MKIFVLYRLKQDITFDEYRQWSLDHDQPALHGCEQVRAFDVFAVERVESAPSYSIVEVIEVESWADWQTATQTDAIRALGRAFERFVDTTSLVVLRGDPITAD